MPSIPALSEGRIMIVTNVGGVAVDAAVSGAQVVAGRDKLREPSSGVLTNGITACGKNVWARRLDAGVKSCGGAKALPGRSTGFP